MSDYRSKLSFQPILSTNTVSIIEALQEGSLTKEQFHNRKAYYKRKGDLVTVLEFAVAFEVVSFIGKWNE